MIWQPLLSSPAMVLASAFVGLICIVSIVMLRSAAWRRRAVLLPLRAIPLCIIAILLLGPTTVIRDEATDAARPTLHIAIDVSPSMGVVDSDVGRSRFDIAADLWRGHHVAAVTDHAAIQWHGLADSVTPLNAPPTDIVADTGATRLFSAIETILHTAAVGDMVLIVSDGHDTTGPTTDDEQHLITLAQSRGVRLFARPVGEPRVNHILLTASPVRVFTDEPVRLTFHHSGFLDSQSTVRWMRDETVVLSEGRGSRDTVHHHEDVPFDSGDADGQIAAYQVRATLWPGDPEVSDAVSNTVRVQHLGKRLRVLLIEGQPGWNSRFITAALRSDPHVDLTSVQALGPQRHAVLRYAPTLVTGGAEAQQDIDLTLPLDAAALERFDVIITGRSLEACMSEDAIAALPRVVAGSSGWVMLDDEPTAYTPAAPPVATGIDMQFGRIGGGRVVKVIDNEVWRQLFTGDVERRETAEAALRAVVRWAALGDATPPTEPDAEAFHVDELADTAALPDVLSRLTRPTGGQVIDDHNLQPIIDALVQHAAEAQRMDSHNTTPAWPRWWVLGLIVVPLIAEWFIRRTGGLP